MKTYLVSLYAEPKDSSDTLSKSIVICTYKPTEKLKGIFLQYLGVVTKSIKVNTGYLTKDIIKNIFLEYLNIEVYSVDYDHLLSKFSAKSLDYNVYIDYEEV